MDKLKQAMALLDEGRRGVWDHLDKRVLWAERVGLFMDEVSAAANHGRPSHRCLCGATTPTTHEEGCAYAPRLCDACCERPVYAVCAVCQGAFCDEHMCLGNDDIDVCQGCIDEHATQSWGDDL